LHSFTGRRGWEDEEMQKYEKLHPTVGHPQRSDIERQPNHKHGEKKSVLPDWGGPVSGGNSRYQKQGNVIGG